MDIIGIIPARYASTRFPGKPLALINGKPMIRRVYEQAQKASSLKMVIVATDDERIYNAVRSFDGEVLMTSSHHSSGTDRCYEVVAALAQKGQSFEVAINIQGDEPYIRPDQIDLLAECFADPDAGIATLVKRIETPDDLFSNTVNKVIIDRSGNAIYFSRQAIPYLQGIESGNWLEHHTYYKHLGIYGYRTYILKEITGLEPSLLEKSESLEQLRWIENGYKIKVAETPFESYSVDRPEDLSKFTNRS